MQLSNYFHEQDKCQIEMHLRALSVLRSVASSTLICIGHNRFRLSPHSTRAQLKTPQWDWPEIITRATKGNTSAARARGNDFGRVAASAAPAVCVCVCVYTKYFLEVNINFEAAQDKRCPSVHRLRGTYQKQRAETTFWNPTVHSVLVSWPRLQHEMAAVVRCGHIRLRLHVMQKGGWGRELVLLLLLLCMCAVSIRPQPSTQSAVQADNRNMTFPCPCPGKGSCCNHLDWPGASWS